MTIAPSHFFYPANIMSLSRLLLAIPITYLVAKPELGKDWLLVLLIGVAILTDMLDGYLSRVRNQTSDLGRILDPIADKVTIISGIIAAVLFRNFPAAVVVLLGYRDIMIVSYGAVVTRRTGRVVIANSWGKLNTFVMACLCLVFAIEPGTIAVKILSYAAIFTTGASGIAYYRFGERYLFTRRGVKYFYRVLHFSLPFVLWAIGEIWAPQLTWL